jgi:peptide chain release factor 3
MNLEPSAVSRIEDEVGRRRTFAIISHPDAGKTTLTEKLLLYGGAIRLAGSVKARRAARHATSDWMEMERERGISVTSSVLQFEYGDFQVNLLDTPGHQDFSEDTYRTLIAADSAVMLLDNRKGVEEQTRKLFKVCKLQRTPIFTFVNKCDRSGEEPLKLLDDVEAELGIGCVPFTWPITKGDRFLGVYDRRAKEVLLFDRGGDHGALRSDVSAGALHAPEIRETLGEDVHDRLQEDVELLDVAGSEFSEDAFLAGEVSPAFFGSALTNFGVEPFLQAFLEMAPQPGARLTASGTVEPQDPDFSGFVFKIQANMDPRHRDRIAFVRICSGRYEPGAVVTNVRSGKDLRLSAPQQFFARERSSAEEAWAGDVVGVLDRGSLRIGDTLATDGGLEFADIPRFSPEHFARILVPDPLRRKHLDTGLRHLSEEGAAQVFYREGTTGPEPIVGAVGMLQFDVLLHRLRGEYGVEARLEALPFRLARWVVGPEGEISRAAAVRDRSLVYDSKGQPLLLFTSEWALRVAIERSESLTFHEVAP